MPHPKSLAEAQRVVERCFCPVCHQKRVAVPGGATCEKWHDRTETTVTRRHLDMADECRRLLSLPLAVQVPGVDRYTIKGRDGQYKLTTKGFKGPTVAATVVLRWGPRKRAFRRIVENT